MAGDCHPKLVSRRAQDGSWRKWHRHTQMIALIMVQLTFEARSTPRHSMRRIVPLVVMFAAARLSAQRPPALPQPSVPDPGVIATGQRITPAGVQSVFDGRVYGVTFGAGSSDL